MRHSPVFSFPCRRPGNSPTSSAPPTGRLCGCCTGLEIRSVLQNAALPRPLLIGDLYGMLRELLTACRRLLDGAGIRLALHMPEVLPPVAAGIEPRITAMAAVALLRCAVPNRRGARLPQRNTRAGDAGRQRGARWEQPR